MYVLYDTTHVSINRIETGREPLVKTAAHLMKNICYSNKDSLSAGVIIAGWDPVEGGQVYNVVSGGSCLKQNYALGGSGSLFIYGLLDAEFREGMAEEEAKALVKKAISHAMARDGSSGGMVRTMTVKAQGNKRDVTPGNQLPFGPVFP
jgi:20S proteasome subunit beta 1